MYRVGYKKGRGLYDGAIKKPLWELEKLRQISDSDPDDVSADGEFI